MNFDSTKIRKYLLIGALLVLSLCFNAAVSFASTGTISEGCYDEQVTPSCYYDYGDEYTYGCSDLYPSYPYFCPHQTYYIADSVSLTINQSGQQFVGSVSLTASASGGSSYHYILYYNSGSGTVEEDLGWHYGSYTFTWRPPAGSYAVAVSASANTLNEAEVISNDKYINITYNVDPTGITISPVNQQTATGNSVTFSAKGQGSSHYEYNFELGRWDGSECDFTNSSVRGWSSSNTYTLNQSAGEYCVAAGVITEYGLNAKWIATLYFVTNGPPPQSVDLSANPPNDQVSGRTVTFNTTASGQGSSYFEYMFWLGRESNGHCVEAGLQERDWSSASSWTTNVPAPGDYCVVVEARTEHGELIDPVYDVIDYGVTQYDTPTGVTITASPEYEQSVGSPVTYTAAGQGSSLYEYYFIFGGRNGGACTWANRVDRNWSSTNTWTRTDIPEGDYCVEAVVRTQYGRTPVYGDPIGYTMYTYAPIEITPDTLPDAVHGVPYYTDVLDATGGQPPYTWSNINSGQSTQYIFPGVSIDPDTGVISGTPNGWNETTSLTIQVKDSRNITKTKEVIFPVHPPLYISPISLPNPNVFYGNAYNQPLTAKGGKAPYSNWRISSGYLPTGVGIDVNTGTISGTALSSGSFAFKVKVSDSMSSSVEQEYTITVYPPINITTTSLPSGTTGVSYNQTITATGGLGAGYCWSLFSGNLPDGLSLGYSGNAGLVSGTPTRTGSYTFTVQAGSNCVSPASYDRHSFTINVYNPIAITTNTLQSGIAGIAYSQTLEASGGNENYTWSLPPGNNLPAGLTLNSAGVISGMPTIAGTYNFTVQVSDSQSPTPATITKPFTIVVAVPLSITTTSLPGGTKGVEYNQTVAANGGNGTYNWTISSGSLPDGLTIDSTTGVIRGIPSNVGSFAFTVQVADTKSTPETASQPYLFNILNSAAENPTTPCPEVPFGSSTNAVSGAVSHNQELFSTKGAAIGTAIELYYSSMPAYNGPLGLGWSHNYDISLKENSDGSVVLQAGSAKSFYSKSGNSYVSPPSDYSTLVKNGDGSYVITYRDGHYSSFRQDGKISSMTDRFTNTISFNYSGSDLTTITDTSGRTTTIVYDQSPTPHRITSVTDPNSKIYNFDYQGNNLYRVTNPAADPAVSQVRGYWEYSYDPPGSIYLKTKTDPNGYTTQYTYYADHRSEKSIDPEGINNPTGHTRTITYPAATGNLRTTTLTEKDGGQWRYTYDVQNGVIKEKSDPNGKVIKYSYYPNGYLKATTEPKDGTVNLTTFYTYDSYGNILTQTDPADLSVYAPPNNNPDNVTDPSTLTSLSPPIKAVIRYSYDNSHNDRITSVSNEKASPFIITNYVYSTENGGEVITATTTPGNYVTVGKKYPNGTAKEIIDANLKSTTFTYYPDNTANRSAGIAGLLQTVTDPAGTSTLIDSYDKYGNPLTIKVKDTLGAEKFTTVQQIDDLNRVKQITKTGGALPAIITKYGYDFVGNLKSSIDAEQRETKYEYNYNRQTTKITNAKLDDTVFTYSGSGCGSCGGGVDKLTGVYDANVTKNTPLSSQPHTAYSYNQLGRLEFETDQLGKKMHYTYYDNGQLYQVYDATAATPGTLILTNVYNNMGQLTEKNFADGTYDRFTYKPSGQLETASNQNISYTYAYYTDGRLQTVTDTTNNRVISYDQYDNLGQRKQVTILKNAGVDERIIRYDYDTANRPLHIISTAGTFTYEYDELGRRKSVAYPNQTTVAFGYDDLSRLNTLNNKITNGAVFAGFGYTDFDKLGNRKSVTGAKNETYGYNELYRIMNVTSAKPEAFDYDPVGNRRSGPSVTDTGYVNNEANQMTTGRKLTYGYDNFGNQTTKTVPGASDKSWVQTWNLQNQLVKVEKLKGTERRTVTFKYDPFGRRIEKQFTTVIDGANKTRTWNYVYDGSNIAVELSTENSTTTKTFYTHGVGVDEHLAMERGGQFYYYHADGLGSITSITDAGQHVVQSYEYDSYGMVKPLNGFENSYAYTGREWDKETGLYYYRARYYDPMEGKFTSKDPIGFEGGINVYAYTSGNPINNVDPSGLEDELRPGPGFGQKIVDSLYRGYRNFINNEGTTRIDVAVNLATTLVSVGAEISILKHSAKIAQCAKSTTVLGENMSKRVIPFAEKTNARTLPFGTTADEWAKLTPKQRWKLNDGALRTRIGEGDSFQYIGRDPYRNPALRQQFDLTGSELLRLQERGISFETVSPETVQSILGRP